MEQSTVEHDPVALLRSLVAIPSVSPGMDPLSEGEKAVGEHLAARARAAGLVARMQDVSPGRRNVLVDLGLRGLPTLALVTHLDTVPGGELSSRAQTIAYEDGRVYGRGACDAKGSLVAMLLALIALHARVDELRVNVQLAALVDEEHTFHGVLTYLRQSTPDMLPVAAIVGEPTGLEVVVAHMGVLRFTLETLGLAAHTSRPDRGINAVDKMTQLLLALRTAFTAEQPPAHPLTGHAALTVAKITGGTAPNVVPDRCTAVLDRRLVPGELPESVLAWFDGQIEHLQARDPELRVIRGEPFVRDAGLDGRVDSPLALAALAARSAVCGRSAPIGVPFGTDGSKLAGLGGIPTIVLGPGDIAQAHTADEWIEVSQVVRASEIYTRCALALG